MMETFEQMLTGGHPNSLGRTLEVVETVLSDRGRHEDLYQCYFSEDEVVRLRVSNAMRRITVEHPDWTMDFMDRLQSEIAAIDQASTQWTLAILFQLTHDRMSDAQHSRAIEIMKNNLANHNDWIVLNNSIQVLTEWAVMDEGDNALKDWLRPHLERLASDPRKSVAARARKYGAILERG